MDNTILKFLLGEGSLDGVWYGDKHPTEQGMFWWRKHLRQYLEQAQLQQPVVMQGPLLWNPYPSVRPTEYGDYFVYRAGKIHKETWNTSGWAYNENTISHWLEISGPSVGDGAAGQNVSGGIWDIYKPGYERYGG